MNEWISVNDKLPEPNQRVLVYAVGKIDGFIGEHTIEICERFIQRIFPSSPGHEMWSSPYQYFHTDYKITHWMFLPEPPTDDELEAEVKAYKDMAKRMDREKVIKGLEFTKAMITFNPSTGEDIEPGNLNEENKTTYDACVGAIALLKEQELPTELKQKMWNALYAEEDEYEKKFVGKEEHLNWFTVYRPWLQKGFDIAINVIAEWEGR